MWKSAHYSNSMYSILRWWRRQRNMILKGCFVGWRNGFRLREGLKERQEDDEMIEWIAQTPDSLILLCLPSIHGGQFLITVCGALWYCRSIFHPRTSTTPLSRPEKVLPHCQMTQSNFLSRGKRLGLILDIPCSPSQQRRVRVLPRALYSMQWKSVMSLALLWI